MKILILLILLISISFNLIYGDEFYTVRKDLRKCAGCGGNFVKSLNSDKQDIEVYINSMEMIDANLKPNKLDGSLLNVIISGEVTTSEDDGTTNLFLKGIYQKMELPNENSSGKQVGKEQPKILLGRTQQAYFFLSENGTNSYIASLINKDKKVNFSSLHQPYSPGIGLLDNKWFFSRLTNKGEEDYSPSAIVLGSFHGKKLDVSAIYINTVDPSYPCNQFESSCEDGKVPTFTRALDRCPIFDKCVNRGPCHLGLPHCQDGYIRYSLASSAKNGCPIHYCDPDSLEDPLNVMGA